MKYNKHQYLTILAGALAIMALALFLNQILALTSPKNAVDPLSVTALNPSRSKIINYKVQAGDTLSSIAAQYSVSPETIMWANSLTSDNIQSGTTLRILPVNGVAHVVSAGETIEIIAEKYFTKPENIMNFPFNEYEDYKTFELIPGETIIVPGGIKQ